MNLNCAILHADPEIAGRLEEYIGKVPFLSCPRPLVSFSLQTPTAMLPNVSVWMRWTI